MENNLSNVTFIRRDDSGSETVYEFIQLCDSETQTDVHSQSSKVNKTSESSTQTDTNSDKDRSPETSTDNKSIFKLVGNRNIAVSGFIQIGNAVALDDKTNCAVTGLLQLSNTSEQSGTKDDCGLTGLLQIGNPAEIGNNDSVAGLIQIGGSGSSQKSRSSVNSPVKQTKDNKMEKSETSNERQSIKIHNTSSSTASCQTEDESSQSEIPALDTSPNEKWITTLGESGLILTKSDTSKSKSESSSQHFSYENLLENTTTSVISAGDDEDAGSYIVIKVKQEAESSFRQESIQENISDIQLDTESLPQYSWSNDSSNFPVKYDSFHEDSSVPLLIHSGATGYPEQIDSDNEEPLPGDQEQIEVEHTTVESQQVVDNQVLYDPVVTEFISSSQLQVGDVNKAIDSIHHIEQHSESSDVDSNSIVESLITLDYSKEKVETTMEELNNYIISSGTSDKSDPSLASHQSANRLAQAHRYLTDYVQQIQSLKEKSSASVDGSKENKSQDTNDSQELERIMSSSVSEIKEKEGEMPLVRKLKARTLSECEKVEAVEGLMQMSKSVTKGTLYPSARKQFDDALKAGLKHIQTDIETYSAVEGLMEIGNTPPKEADANQTQKQSNNPDTKNFVKGLLQDDSTLSADSKPIISIKNLPYVVYRCVNCEQTFLHENDVVAISRSADFRRLYMCHDCHKAKKDGFLHKCRLCGAGFQAIRALEQHFEHHELKYIYRCDYCGKGFGYHGRNRYLAHERTHKGPNPCFCTICGMQFARAQYLQMHIDKTHKRKKMHFCEICGQFFSREDQLRAHYRSQHFCYDTTSREVSDYRCGICNEVYPSLYMLNTHLVLHTRLSQGTVDMYECLVCNKRFKTVRNLQKHHLRLHPDKALYTCDVCNKSFQSPNVRNAHMVKHQKSDTAIKEEKEIKQDVNTEQTSESEQVVSVDGTFDETITSLEQSQQVAETVDVIHEEKGSETEKNSDARGVNLDKFETIIKNQVPVNCSDSTEVVFGLGSEENEPTILVEMRTPKSKTELTKSSGKLKSLITPESLAMLQKKKLQKEEKNNELTVRENETTSVKTTEKQPDEMHSTSDTQTESVVHSASDTQAGSAVHSASDTQTGSAVHRTSDTQTGSAVHKTSDTQTGSVVHSTSDTQTGSAVHSTSDTQTGSAVQNPRETQTGSVLHSASDTQSGQLKVCNEIGINISKDSKIEKSFEFSKKEQSEHHKFPKIKFQKTKSVVSKNKKVADSKEKEKLSKENYAVKINEEINKIVQSQKAFDEIDHSIDTSQVNTDDINLKERKKTEGKLINDRNLSETSTSDDERFLQIDIDLGQKTILVKARGDNLITDDSSEVEIIKSRGNKKKPAADGTHHELSPVVGSESCIGKEEAVQDGDNVKMFQKECIMIPDETAGKTKGKKRKSAALVDSGSLNKETQKPALTKKDRKESTENEKDVEMIRKSSRKVQHTRKLIESMVEKNSKKNLVQNSGENQEIIPTLTSSSQESQELANIQSEKNIDHEEKKLRSKDFQKEFLKYSNFEQNDGKTMKEKSAIDKNCSVVLHDVGESIKEFIVSGQCQVDSNVQTKDSNKTFSVSSWSEKFQEFIGKQTDVIPSHKRTSETITENIDTTAKKVSKK